MTKLELERLLKEQIIVNMRLRHRVSELEGMKLMNALLWARERSERVVLHPGTAVVATESVAGGH